MAVQHPGKAGGDFCTQPCISNPPPNDAIFDGPFDSWFKKKTDEPVDAFTWKKNILKYIPGKNIRTPQYMQSQL